MACHALRGAALSFRDDPFRVGVTAAMDYQPDALVVIEGGHIKAFGPYAALKPTLAPDTPITPYTDALILPGFIDLHVHYPQLPIIGAHGAQLIDWLNRYTFPAEQQFADPAHARAVASLFLDECLRVGTTTAMVYGTVHAPAAEVFLSEAHQRGMRMIGGKVLMDRHAPAALLDTAQTGYDQSKALLEKWQGVGRLGYAITPRFAPTSSPAQLEAAGALWREFPHAYMQTHISENHAEIAWVQALFPDRRDYLDVYDHYGLVGQRAVFGHGIHLTPTEWQRLSETGAAVAHCPTSNTFLGSGLFRLNCASHPPTRWGLGTDVGGGTSLSLLTTMGEAYKVAALAGQRLGAVEAFYLATRGAAEALYLEDKIGSLAPGIEADLVVLNLKSTPLIEFRMKHCQSIEEVLAVLMTMADDRATQAVYVAGQLAYGAPGKPSTS
ncbi:MAG: guanine deaminase [Betaproteobacteria bacterium]|nr:guanine deaminase [Betaproteobacteria bacterium]